MNDKQLIEAVAELWLENGGDSDGFLWCINNIHIEIYKKEKEKNETSSHSI
jgi:hypothetical protein